MSIADKLEVMVVDDTSVSRMLITKRSTRSASATSRIAKDGAQALRRLMTKPVHLVISDMNMPGLDGLGLLKALAREQSDERASASSSSPAAPTSR